MEKEKGVNGGSEEGVGWKKINVIERMGEER